MSLLSKQSSPTTQKGQQKPRDITQDDPNILLGRLAIHSEVLSSDKVKSALEAWLAVADDQDFGTFLVAEKYLEPETLDKLVRAREDYLKQRQGTANGVPTGSPNRAQNRAPTGIPKRAPNGATNEATNRTSNGAGAGASKTPFKTNVRATQAPLPEGEPVLRATAELEPVLPREPVPVVAPEIKPFAVSTKAVEVQVKTNESDLLHYGPDVTLSNLLQQAIELNASDLHVHSEASLRVRLDGVICDATTAVLSSQECGSLIRNMLNERQRKLLEEKFQVDFAYEIPGVGRFRANAYKQQRGLDAVFRTIKPTPPTLAELGLPEDLERFTEFHQGLVLFTGPAGCGKSSTMAAMVSLINEHRTDHILTIEDPIEYLHTSASCNVSQRETGAHTESFARALRAALREDPDVIVIGELRDLETISLALTAAETGHLVLGTLHTSNAIRTVNRLLGVFPPDQQAQIRMMLSESLKVVISQRLVTRAKGGERVAALEVMINNNAISNLIRDNRTHQIKSSMQTGGGQGQRLIDASLTMLMKDKVITKEEAIRHAEEPGNFT